MKRTACVVSSLNCQVENGGPPTHIASLSSSRWGKQDVFHPARLRDQSERLLRWNWPQFAPLHVSHLSNIYNPIVLLTSPPPPPAEQHTSDFPSCMARCLGHLTDPSPPLAHYCTIYSLCTDATTYLKSTLFVTIYSTVSCGHGRMCPRSDETMMYPCCLNNLLTIALACSLLQRAACV